MLLSEDALVSLALARIVNCRSCPVLIVLPDTSIMERCAVGLSDLCSITGEGRRILPMPEVAPRRNMWIPENEAGRCAVLQAALSRENAIYLATPSILMTETIAPKIFKSSTLSLKTGMKTGLEELSARLVELDYDNEIEVHVPGEFARRGGIVDVYSPLYEAPVRIEFWGDEIDSMRFFAPDTQRSYKDVEEIKIVPRGTAVMSEQEGERQAIRNFFERDICTVFVDPRGMTDRLVQYFDRETSEKWSEMTGSFIEPIEVQLRADDPDDDRPFARMSAMSVDSGLAALLPEMGESAAVWHWQQLRDSIRRWNASGYLVVACCSEEGEVERFGKILEEHEETVCAADGREPTLPMDIVLQHLDRGMMIPDAGLVLLSARELFGRRVETRRKKALEYRHEHTQGDELEIEEGDHVVHAIHGIARFHGIRRVETQGELQEVMLLEFASEEKLYVPLDQAYLVSRYLGAGKGTPALSRLHGQSWRKAREAAEKSAIDLAAELIKMDAMRESARGCAMKPVIEWERSFANSFPYKETPDQTAAIRDVLADMEQEKPMDRLLCGDVGYGKTEVAMRAAFRAVLNGCQVAVLVPTTILAQQHYSSFCQRMAEYPVTIEVMSRFKTPAQQKAILERVATGEIDILIGTHRIVQDDVHFRKLGLLVIDEEQRFGVEHKQRLKAMRADMDILTMTATPIPRTLYFSLAGIRNLSTIMTPPVDRLPVTTVVAKFDKQLIQVALKRELERGGQVFFLYNRVLTIDKMRDMIQELVPGARVVAAHGQMHERQLEGIILDFVEKKIDVLVCTTIVESGVDIQNVNTIIIDRADRFGLSDLYQLRGRVGRHHRQAYAYLLLPPMGELARDARERMAAMRSYTSLGSGFSLALRDLEIRGAGNILGVEQSGHIAAVGFEMYCRLLKDAVRAMTESNRRRMKKPVQCSLYFEGLSFAVSPRHGMVCAGIPEQYIPEISLRIECYKRISNAESADELRELMAEFTDRFGQLPVALEVFFEYSFLRVAANRAGILSIRAVNGKLIVETDKGIWKDDRMRLPEINACGVREQIGMARRFVENNFRGR